VRTFRILVALDEVRTHHKRLGFAQTCVHASHSPTE
jgi:hypothetical protein